MDRYNNVKKREVIVSADFEIYYDIPLFTECFVMIYHRMNEGRLYKIEYYNNFIQRVVRSLIQ